ncbi:MAG: HRDC domain-containing protein [Planctomycetota bacterium]
MPSPRPQSDHASTIEERPDPVWIDDPKSLAKLVRVLERQTEFAIDTEANSMFAYQERLCLVQISTKKRDYVIDPFEVDIEALAPALADPGITKVLHGAEFDVLMLKRTAPIEIASIFDTRVAASSLGETQLGLAGLLKERFSVELDKRHQRSDWGRRPLSPSQIDYARRDTCYLLELANQLRTELHDCEAPHSHEVGAECRRLAALEPSPVTVDLGKLKGAGRLDGHGRRALEHLNGLRHDLARARDVPLFKVLSNDLILALATKRPRNRNELDRIPKMPRRFVEQHGSEVIAVLAEAKAKGPSQKASPDTNGDPKLRGAEAETYERLRKWRQSAGERRGVENALILPRPMLFALAMLRPQPKSIEDLAGAGVIERWRALYYGDEILDALRG